MKRGSSSRTKSICGCNWSKSTEIYSAVDQRSYYNSMLVKSRSTNRSFPATKDESRWLSDEIFDFYCFFFIWADRDRSFWWSHGRIAAFNKAAKYFSNTVLGPVNQSCRFSLLWKLKDELLLSYISLITVFFFVYWTQVIELILREVNVQCFKCPRSCL